MYIIVLVTLQVMFSFCTGSITGSYLELRATNFHKRPIPGSLVFIYRVYCLSSGICLNFQEI